MSGLTLRFLLLLKTWKAGVHSEKGATAVEYGLLVALIAAVIIVVVATLGTQINTAFSSVSSQL
ncbi:Flp family type IVb pilin [Pseudarthrobacter enclensis]|uniref:Pilus assembly protein Flp/PilA n=1 Tax=Pseudarthrobacter enclensis TaxID=993070 RepID=A0ABT9RPE8_9MICC|nr:Flp family type IVb pilin [Pseudarthrobacter enclensis]MDP9887106.1 pilus assembly protein Flp/PilA [Pseudarthrobacter enclensis]